MQVSRILFVVALLVSFTAKAGESSAPFGLKWGADIGSIAVDGVEFEETVTSGRLTSGYVKNLKSRLSDKANYAATFDKEFGLQRVMSFISNDADDAAGTNALSLFKRYSDILNDKYGAPVSMHRTHNKAVSKNLAHCIALGCAVYGGHWKSGDVAVFLEIKSVGASATMLSLEHMGPNWEEAVRKSRADTKENDKKAL